MNEPSPLGQGGHLRLVRVDFIPVQFATTNVHVDVPRAQPSLSFPRIAADPEEDDDGKREI